MAIREAREYAESIGFHITDIDPEHFHADFMISRKDQIAIVRVRRIKYRSYDVAAIGTSCRKEIGQLRLCPVFGRVNRELWVRGPERTWHRYRVSPDRIKHIGHWEVSRELSAEKQDLDKLGNELRVSS